jgi:AcrR family transcriptional regulator
VRVVTATQPLDSTRERILHATLELLAEAGPDGFGVREVARRSDTTTGSVYHFFDGKAGLVDSTMTHFGELIGAELATAIDDANGGIDGLRAIARVLGSASVPGWRRSFHLSAMRTVGRPDATAIPPFGELVTGPLRDAIASGELDVPDGATVDEIVDLVAAALGGFLQMAETPLVHTPGGRMVELFVDTIERALTPSRARTRAGR